MERLQRHYLVPLLMVLILFLFGLAILLGVIRRVRRLQADTIFVAIPIRPEATAEQRFITPAATYPPYALDLVPAAMRQAEPEADLRGRIENLAMTLTAPVPTAPGGPTWTATAPPSLVTTENSLTCTTTVAGLTLYSSANNESSVIAILQAGEIVQATGRSADNLWVSGVTASGQRGWADQTTLTCAQPVTTLPINEP